MVRPLPEGPAERDRQAAADGGRRRTRGPAGRPVPVAADAQDAAPRVPGRSGIGSTGKVARTLPRRKARLETFGAPVLRVALSSPNGWPHVVAVLSALTPHGREIVVSSGGARVRLGRSRSGSKIRLISQVTTCRPGRGCASPSPRTSTAQSSGNLLYLPGIPRVARLVVGPRPAPCRCSRSRYRAESIDSRVTTES